MSKLTVVSAAGFRWGDYIQIGDEDVRVVVRVKGSTIRTTTTTSLLGRLLPWLRRWTP